MKERLRTTGWMAGMALCAALACVACRQESASVPAAMAPTGSDAAVADTALPQAAGVTVALPQPLPAWVPPVAELQLDEVRDALRRATVAVAEGRLYRDAGDAIPLYLSVLAVQPDNRDATRGLKKAKAQLLRTLDDAAPDPALAELERRVLREANTLGIGPMGLGGSTTLLGVKVATLPRLPASYFVSVAYGCWACRRGIAARKVEI